MLQWMGGSRRKVTASRRSTEKRQRQYFEQRRKRQQFQQQQTAGLESYDEGISTYGQHHREPRSLDVINLLNLSTTAQEYSSYAANERKEEQAVNTSAVKPHTARGPSRGVSKTASPSDSVQLNEARVPSDNQIKNVSPQSDVSSGHPKKSDIEKATMDQKLSIFDLLGDDIPYGESEGHPEREDHVAFSVEGLGKVGAETPVHSPKQSGRIFGIGISSPRKAARRKLSQNINYLSNYFELEVDSMVQDIDMPLNGGSLGIPIDIRDHHFSEPEENFSSFRDYRQVGDCSRVMKCSFDEKELFHYKENGLEDMWDATSSFCEENLFCEKETNTPWKNWPCQADSDLADFTDCRKYKVSDYPFEGHHQLKRRESKKATGILNEPDANIFRHRMFEMDHTFETFNRASNIIQPNLDFGNPYIQPNWSCFTTEDVKDDLSLPSEESCSSAAVRDEERNNVLSESAARQSRICYNGSPERKSAAKKIFFEELQIKIGDDIPQENKRSARCTQTSIPSYNKPVHPSMSPCQENIGPPDLSFREGHSSFEMGSGFSSLSPVPGTKFPSSYSKHWAEDALPKRDSDAKYIIKRDSSANRNPSSSFISKKFSFSQPFSYSHASPTWSTALSGGTTNADSELGDNTPSDSSHENAGSHGGSLALGLSAEGNDRTNEDDEFKRQPPKNDKEPREQGAYGTSTTVADDLNSMGDLPEAKEAKIVILEPKEGKETCELAEETMILTEVH